jgi:hypothetical protein
VITVDRKTSIMCVDRERKRGLIRSRSRVAGVLLLLLLEGQPRTVTSHTVRETDSDSPACITSEPAPYIYYTANSTRSKSPPACVLAGEKKGEGKWELGGFRGLVSG